MRTILFNRLHSKAENASIKELHQSSLDEELNHKYLKHRANDFNPHIIETIKSSALEFVDTKDTRRTINIKTTRITDMA